MPISSQANQQQDAIANAQQAFLIQSGIQSNINKLESYGATTVKAYVPNELLSLYIPYKIFRNRAIEFKLNKADKINITTNSIGWAHSIF